MKQVRQNVFETNSSSSHSLTTSIAICTEEEYQDFIDGKLFVDFSDHKMTKEKKCGYSYDEYKDMIKYKDCMEDSQVYDICSSTTNGTEFRIIGFAQYD